MKIIIVVLFTIFCVYGQTCDDAYVIQRNGVDYLRLNGTNDLYACSNTNLCDTLRSLQSATERVVLIATRTTGPNIPDSIWSPLVFDTAVNDTHHAYSTSTGIFKTPVAGFYVVEFSIVVKFGTNTGYVTSTRIGVGAGCSNIGTGYYIGGSNLNGVTSGFSVGEVSVSSRGVGYIDKGVDIQPCLYQTSGASKTPGAAGLPEFNYFRLYRL